MIQQNSAEHAYSLASHYAEKGLSVIAKPNSLLAEMVKLTNVTGIPLIPPVTGTDASESTVVNISKVSSGTAQSPSDHDLFVDNAANQISKAVLSHISFAKNVVKPVVLDVGAAIDKAAQSFKAENPAASICIKELDVPKMVDEFNLSEELSRYDKATIVTPNGTAAHSSKTYEEILPLLLTGDQDTDEAIAEWYSSLDHAWVDGVWRHGFEGTSFQGSLPTDNIYTRLNTGLLMYLLGRRFMEDTTHTVEKGILSVYKEKMAIIRDYGGALAMNSLARIRAYDRTNVIVINVDPYAQVCYVHSGNYRKWLASGGRPEVILGMVVSGDTIVQGSELLESRDRLLNVWNSYVSYISTNVALQKFEAFKTSLALAVRDSYTTVTEQEKEAWTQIPNFEQKAAKLLECEIAKVTSAEMEDPYGVATKLVCRTRFFYTEAEQILTGIEAVMKENPDIEPREAATISVLLYVADYIADQLALSV